MSVGKKLINNVIQGSRGHEGTHVTVATEYTVICVYIYLLPWYDVCESTILIGKHLRV